jgi:cytochrome c
MTSRIMMASSAALVAALFASFARAGGGDADRGGQLYESRCTGCHALDANRIGPMHRGVFGRKAGSVPDFAYSPALKRSGIVWNESALLRWLADPEKLVPGQRMGYQVPEAVDRQDLVAYLRRESQRPPPGKG